MQHVLVIANRTAVGPHVTTRLYEIKGDAPELGVHVVVPATPRPGPGADEQNRPIHDASGVERAGIQLRAAMSAIEKIGATVTGSVGPADPMKAVAMAMADQRIDRIVVSTLPPGASRWLAMDLPHRLRRRYNVEVDHIIGTEVEEPASRTPVAGPVRVLLIEDQPADVALTREALARASVETDLIVARNGAEAIEALRAFGPSSANLILLDLKMPVVDGHEFLERVGQEFDAGRLNIVVSTTSTSEDDRQRAHALGAGAYVVKDPDFDVFAETLVSLIEEVAAGAR